MYCPECYNLQQMQALHHFSAKVLDLFEGRILEKRENNACSTGTKPKRRGRKRGPLMMSLPGQDGAREVQGAFG